MVFAYGHVSIPAYGMYCKHQSTYREAVVAIPLGRQRPGGRGRDEVGRLWCQRVDRHGDGDGTAGVERVERGRDEGVHGHVAGAVDRVEVIEVVLTAYATSGQHAECKRQREK